MVQTLYKNIGAILFALAVIALIAALQIGTTEASTFPGTSYQAKNVLAASIGTSSVRSTFGEVGSIVVSSTSPISSSGPMLAFYDTASTTIATTSMTAVFTFGAKGAVTPPAGTYTFDVGFGKGIYMWVNPSFNGTYTVTYR